MARCFTKNDVLHRMQQCLEMLHSSSSEEEDEEWVTYAIKELSRYEQHVTEKKKQQQEKMKRKAEDGVEQTQNSAQLDPAKKQKLYTFEQRLQELRARTDKSKSERCKKKVELFKELVTDISQIEEE